jgi:hypothetical protein
MNCLLFFRNFPIKLIDIYYKIYPDSKDDNCHLPTK